LQSSPFHYDHRPLQPMDVGKGTAWRERRGGKGEKGGNREKRGEKRVKGRGGRGELGVM